MELINLCIFGILLLILLICLGKSNDIESKILEGFTQDDVVNSVYNDGVKEAKKSREDYQNVLNKQGYENPDGTNQYGYDNFAGPIGKINRRNERRAHHQPNSADSAANVNDPTFQDSEWSQKYNNSVNNAQGLSQGGPGASHRGNGSDHVADSQESSTTGDQSFYKRDDYYGYFEKSSSNFVPGAASSNMDDVQDNNQNNTLIGGCGSTQFGCCDDGTTSASGPNGEGCPTPDHKKHHHHRRHHHKRHHHGGNQNNNNQDNNQNNNNQNNNNQNNNQNNNNQNNNNQNNNNQNNNQNNNNIQPSNSMPGTIAPGTQGIPGSQIPTGQEDMYILRSQVVPPVCPACPPVLACPSKGRCPPCPAPQPVPPCPPCARCPEPAFTCKKVPDYKSPAVPGVLPRPILNDFSQFRLP